MRVGILQPLGKSVLSSDECAGNTILEGEIGIGVADIDQRFHELVAQPHFDGRSRAHAKAVLHEPIRIPLPKLHLRNARLALFHGRQAEQEAGES